MATLDKCRYCARLVRWVGTPEGRRFPIDPDPVDTGSIVIGNDGRARFLVRRARQCRVCGCTQDQACRTSDGYGCSWIEVDVCSECEGKPRLRYSTHATTCTEVTRVRRAPQQVAEVRRATYQAIEEGRTAAEGLPPAAAAAVGSRRT